MANRSENGGATAHSAAIKALSDARQNTRKYRYLMERSDRVVENAIFADPGDSEHPQKLAHSAVIDYHEEVNQPEYTVKMNDLWQENLTGQNGKDITIEVPEADRVTKTVGHADGLENIVPDRGELDTTEETVSLENLVHRWSGRHLTVEVTVDSPYHESSGDTREEIMRLWLPPKAIKAAYRQLNSALSKIGLLAQTTAPVEHDPEPI